MDEVAKLLFWLELYGTDASWEEIERRFKVAFPHGGAEVSQMGNTRLNGLMVSRGMVRFGKTTIQ